MQNYILLIEKLLTEGKTTGNNHSPELIEYTTLNLQRLKRWLKTGILLPETEAKLRAITVKQKWIVLTEAWCGDAAHSLGFIYKMSELNPNITFEWKLRDENIQLMDQYLTNGGRSIPKLISFDENGNELFNWGPRPASIQAAYLKMKSEQKPYSEIMPIIQKMYNDDKGISIQKEIIALIN